MPRRTRVPVVLAVCLIAMLAISPATLGRQEVDPSDPQWSDLDVKCDGGESVCTPGPGFETYTVNLVGAQYVPEVTYPYLMVVRVADGTIAFRAETPNVVVSQASNSILVLTTDDPIPFGTPPSELPATPVFHEGDALTDEQCSRGTGGLANLCLLDQTLFENEQTFVKLGQNDILYLPPNSTCFFCNSETSNAQLEIWAPGTDSIWSQLGAREVRQSGPTRLDGRELHNVRRWMRNPGSPCH